MKKLLLIAALLVTSVGAHAECKKPAPDNGPGWVDCDTGKPVADPKPRAVQGDNLCLQGVWAAYESYSALLYALQEPNESSIKRMLDFRIRMQPFPASKAHAYKAFSYIANRMYDAGVESPQDWEVTFAAEEYIKRECQK